MTNIAYATNGTVTSATDTKTVTAVKTPALSIAKTALPTTYDHVGQVIIYSFVVKNVGNVTLSGPFTVADDKSTDETCPTAPSLAPGAQITCTASYTITQANLDSGSVTNVASASNGTVTSPTDTATVTAVASPALSIDKAALPMTYDHVGQVIAYSFLVTNTGNVTLSGPFTVADDKATDEACPATPSLAPGAALTCTATYTITQANLDAGSVTNVASASNSTVTSPTDTVTVTAVQTPALTLTKNGTLDMTVVPPAGRVDAGDKVNYTLTATNTGNVVLHGVTIVDAKLGSLTCVQPATLAPGGQLVCTGSYTVTQGEIDAGKVDNQATADSTETPPVDTPKTVPLTKVPALSIDKTALPTTYDHVGQVIAYSFAVTNSGNTTLSGPFTVADDKAADEACPATASLAPGASITCTATYTITLANLDAGAVTNVASASNGTITSPTDTATVTAVQNTALSIVKTALPTTYDHVGQVIAYSFLVTNSGNVTLSGPFTVSDDKATDEACPPTATLAPGSSITCTATYTITQADLDSGSVTNVASASNGTVTSPTDTATVTAVQNPGLSLTKDGTLDMTVVAPAGRVDVGDKIDYTLTATNTGNTTLHGVTIVDAKLGSLTCVQPATLAPGAQLVCTGSYTVTQGEIDAGKVDNQATADSTETPPVDTPKTVPLTKAPELAIDKTALPMTYTHAGQVIAYSFVVTNSGNTTLFGPFTVVDDKANDETCPATPALAPGASITCSATYTITQADVDSGSVTNIAHATNGSVTSPTDTVTVTALTSPGLSLTKDGTLDMTVVPPAGRVDVGDKVDYTLTAENTGGITLHGVTIVDAKLGSLTCAQPATLAPGAQLVCTGSYTVTQGEIDAGKVDNQATADSTETPPVDTPKTVPLTKVPGLSIDKTALPTTYDHVGQAIGYSYVVTNSGNTTLTGPFTVDDDKSTDESCPATPPLAPGSSVTCTASYTITQADIDAGSVTNVASASNGTVTSPTDTATVNAVPSPGLSLTKNGALDMTVVAPAGRVDAGDKVDYTLTATNTGNTTLHGVTIVDAKLGSLTCTQPATLAPGAQLVCTGSYTVTQGEIDAGKVDNTATADSTETPPIDTPKTIPLIKVPALAIDKAASPMTYINVGQVIHYSYLVTNTGNTTLAGPFTVSDDKSADESCPVTPSLAPGASITCTATYTITQADIDGGSVTNVASASNGVVASPTDTVTVTAVTGPALDIDKTASPMTYDHVGQVITYSYVVTNSGNTTLSSGLITVVDDKSTDETCPPTMTLTPLSSITCTATYTITQADLDSGSVTNVAYATNGTITSGTDTVTVTAVQSPALSLTKNGTLDMTVVAPAGRVDVGDKVDYTLTATNTGNVTLHGVTIVDAKLGALTCGQPATLAPGAQLVCTGSYTVTQGDIDAGKVDNQATADSTETPPVDTPKTVPLPKVSTLSIVKSALPTTYDHVGQVVGYTYLVTNSGNTTLSGPFTVDDDKSTDESCPATGSLAPGASITCTATYTITQADLDSGSVTNVASASNGTVTSPTDTATVTAVQNPGLSLTKDGTLDMTVVAPAGRVDVGDKINYTLTATNTGNTTLYGVTIVDAKLGTLTCAQPATLAPGGQLVCTGSYIVTQGEIDAGKVDNQATADSTETPPVDTPKTVPLTKVPALAIDKTALPMTYNVAGQVINYSFLVTNTGNTTLVGGLISVVDDKTSNETCPPTAVLAPGASITCTASYTITQADVDAGSVTNIAYATNGSVTSPTDTVTVTSVNGPDLSLTKDGTLDMTVVPPAGRVDVGDKINYTLTATNTGNTTLHGVTIVDAKLGSLTCVQPATLAPGQQLVCTGSYTVTQGDINAGKVDNQATADSTETPPVDTPKTVPLTKVPALALVKTALPATYDSPGDVIAYTYVVTNTGNTTLAGPFTIDDDKSTDESCPATPSLAPGVSVTCTASYTITQSDVDAGSVTNVASASNGTVTSPTDTVTVNAVQTPGLSLTKDGTLDMTVVAPAARVDVGDKIDYTLTATNTGNTTLHGVTIVDAKLGSLTCVQPATLTPGQQLVCTGSYTVTQGEIDAGKVDNQATADSTETPPVDTPKTVPLTKVPGLAIDKTALPMTYNVAGQVINYSYLVTNTGNTTLIGGLISVVDDKSTDETCPPTATLAPAASITCTATYTITQADIDSGSVTNVAYATNGAVTSPTDTVTVTALTSPGLSLTKDGTLDMTVVPPAGRVDVGDKIDYTLTATNTGGVTLHGVTIVDAKLGSLTCVQPATLTPGQQLVCTGSYTVTQGEIDAGKVDNQATADSTETPPVDTPKTVPLTQVKTLALVKSALPTTYDHVGQVIGYSYLVTNTGNTTLAGPFTIDDDKSTDESCPATPSLLPGASINCTATYTIAQADIDAGSVTNIATASNGNVTSPSDTETVTAVQTKALAIDKSALPTTYDHVGQVIAYTFLVTNTGNTTLAGPFTVSDDKTTNETCPATASLAPGAAITCTASYTITQADLDAGSVTNVASASNGTVTSPTDTATITAVQVSTLSIVKTALPTTYDHVGQVIAYSFAVKNTGNTTLVGGLISVVDDKTSNETCPPTAILAPGASITCTASYTITQADLDSGSFTNVAYATNGTVTSATDTATVTAVQSPGLSLTKDGTLDMTVVAPAGRVDVGDKIDYTLTATNTGNTTLHGVTIVDAKLGALTCVQPTTLAPGAQLACTGSYTVTQGDIDAGKVDNQATADSTETPPVDTPKTVPLTKVSTLSIDKAALPTTYNAAGDVIGYSYVVTNTGNSTLTGPFTVADDKSTDESCPATPSLAPGAAITCTASYTIKQADVDSGSVTNVASASNGTVTSPTDTATVTAIQTPGLSLTKDGTLDMTVVAPATRVDVGDKVDYTLTATNTGNITLHGVTIDDAKLGSLTCAQPATLAPGGQLVCTGSYTVTQGEIDAGKVDNTATADSTESPPVDTPKTVPLTKVPALSLTKVGTLDTTVVAPASRVDAGDKVNYTLTATNTGNTTLTGVTIVDAKLGTLTCTQPVTLAPGGQLACTGSYTVTQGDIDAGKVDNTATADSTETPPTDTPNTVPLPQVKTLSLDKTATESTYFFAGDTIHYQYLVANTGNTSLAGLITVNDDKTTVTCPAVDTVGDLDTVFDPGESLTCTATYTVVAADITAGSITNHATASAASVSSNQDSVTIPGTIPTSDLAVTKASTPKPYVAGAPLTYTITVTNNGPHAVSNATVSDTIPGVLSNVTWSCSITTGTGNCDGISGTGNVISTTVDLANGAVATYVVTGDVNAATTGTITNTVTVAAPAGVLDPTPGNNVASDSNPTTPVLADPAIAISPTSTSVGVGATVPFMITVSNNGPSAATGVKAVVSIPSGYGFISASGMGWTCSLDTNLLSCDFAGSFASGASSQIALQLAAPGSTGHATVPASATSVTTDTNMANNDASATIDVTAPTPQPPAPKADLSLVKTASAARVTTGDQIRYTLTVTNNGPDPAQNVTVVDTLPVAITYVSASGTDWTCSAAGNVVTCDRASLASGAAAVVTVVGTANHGGTSVVNAGSVTSKTPDPSTTNNAATATIDINAKADLAVTKTVSSTTFVPGNKLAFTVTVTNKGPDNAAGARVRDVVPAELDHVSWTCSAVHGRCSSFSGTGSIDQLVDVDVDGRVVFTVVGTVHDPAPATLANTAVVTPPAGTVDPVLTNNMDGVHTKRGVVPTHLGVSISPELATLTSGIPIPVTVVTRNAGKATAKGVITCVSLPPGITVAQAKGGFALQSRAIAQAKRGSAPQARYCWRTKSLVKGARVTFHFKVRGDSRIAGRVRLVAQAQASNAPLVSDRSRLVVLSSKIVHTGGYTG